MIEILEKRTLLSTVWYVAANGGANSNPGTLAQPFQTIQAAANVAQPGDFVLIEGGAYHETVKPLHSGTAAAPITYEAYAGQSVTIDGADTLSGWTPYSGSIYQAPQNWDLGDGNNQVVANGGQLLTEARWPNTSADPLNIATATISSTNAKAATQDTQTSCTINNAGLNQAAGYWVGATIHFSPGEQWVWETGTVTASSPGSITISYTQLTPYEVPKAGNPFYLTGKLSQLDAPGEFFHDPTTNTEYVWMPDSSAPTNNVEAKHRQYAFDLSGLSYINVNSVYIRSATINTSSTSSHIGLVVINAAFISTKMDNAYPWGDKSVPHTTGIILNGSYNSITDSFIAYSSGDGVFLGGSHDSVINDTIVDADYSGADEAGVSMQGTYDTVAHTSVNNCGRSGITFYNSSADQIIHDAVYNIGERGGDSGGVYTYATNANGTEIAYNEIFNLHQSGYGNSGILLDDNSSNIIVDHNLVFNVDSALKMNGTSTNDSIYNNTLVGTLLLNGVVGTTNALIAGATPVMMNDVFENNIMIGSTMFLTGSTQDHNIFTAGGAGFVSQAASNYALAAGSSAIDTGIAIAPYTNGFVGAAPDIGALEYGGTGVSVGVPTVVRSATTQVPAQSYDAELGTNITLPGVGSLDAGDYLEYGAVDFRNPISTFTANLAVPAQYAGHQIQVRVDSPNGPVLGTLTVASTGSFTTFASESTALNPASGIRDLYLVFQGGYGVCNLNWFQLS
ncbi:MAG TPA: carbohydrate-binding protein [Tepidisphaeraceae bacterium]|nr:carbohydrate-binding protein [Tepidisphaeraceae bacterium]